VDVNLEIRYYFEEWVVGGGCGGGGCGSAGGVGGCGLDEGGGGRVGCCCWR